MLLLLTFAVCVAGGLIPFIHADVYVIAAAFTVPPVAVPWLIAVSTAGQVLGKAITYFAGSGLVHPKLLGRHDRLHRLHAASAPYGPAGQGLVLTSAVLGVPPFSLVSFACGAVHFGIRRFIVIAVLGRVVRLSAITLLPQLLRSAL